MTEAPEGPAIEGLKFVRYLEKGGYSHVYEYEQKKPKMRVAVKVLDDSRLSEVQLAQFAGEAETMAELADHPYIVQVFNTGTTDSGQPYVVMKFFSGKNLGARAATTRFAVADVLKLAIQITSAVETAHRGGILHRDIKPANILMDAHGWPGLADFGIAGRVADTDNDDDVGVSIPWSPPEVLSGASNGSAASDVYSLAATFWHLLAGRSPFEVPGGDNSNRALMGRILKAAPPATGRADAPTSLDRLLQQAMSKNPQQRPGTALELARALQAIEQEQRYARTEIIVAGLGSATHEAPVRPQAPASAPTPQDNSAFAPPAESTPASVSMPSHTTVRPSRVTPAPPPEPRPAPVPVNRNPVPLPPRPATTTPEDGTRQRPARSVEPAPAAAAPAPAVFAPPQRTRAELAAAGIPNSTERRPVTPSQAGSPEAAPARRGVKSTVVAALAVTLVVAVAVVGILVSGGGGKGQKAAPPHTPSGTDQGGFGTADVQPPEVTSSYNAVKKVVTFTWKLTAGAATEVEFVYSINNATPVGPTKALTVSVPAKDPTTQCISVGSVGTDGVRHLADTVCGSV